MKKSAPMLWLMTIAGFAATPAAAQVYKCTVNGVTTYSENPCGDKSRTVHLKVYQPNASERSAARQRAQADRRDVAAVDAERARLAYEREVDRSQRASREAAHESKCAGLQASAKAADNERELYATQRYRDDADRRKREYEARHFSECYSK